MKKPEIDEVDFDFLVGGGQMSRLIGSLDWGQTPLGPIGQWPQSLKTSVSLMLNSQHPMWIGWGPQVTFLYNDAYIQVLSLAKHPWALGKPAAEVWREIWNICGPIADKVFQRGEASFLNDVRLFMNRGEFIEETFYSFSYSPIRDESGRVAGLFCPSAEVTAKLLNARRLRTLSELAAESLIEKSTDGACAAAATILARNPDDLPFVLLYLIDTEGKTAELQQTVGVGKGQRLVSPETVRIAEDETRWRMAEVLRTAQAQEVSVTGLEGLPLGASGQPVTGALVLPLVSRGQVRPLGILVAGINPTRKLDPEYRAFYDLMASHLATAIQNARAAAEEKRRADMLTELDRAKTTFFSNISHELRTPLTLILGPLEDEMRERGGQHERLELVHRNSLRLLKLVNTLLDFSRIEAGRMEASYEPTDLSAYTMELASAFRSGVERAGLRLVVDCPSLAMAAYVDRDMWEKMVFNLLSNAFKFTSQGEIEVKLREVAAARSENSGDGGRVLAAGRELCLTVRDTGTGIPAGELPRVFERFHRVCNAWSRSHEGTGIGLALVQELARQHGGRVTVESEAGRGSTFSILIPTGKAHLPAERISAARMLDSTSDGARAYVDEARRWLPDRSEELVQVEGAPGGTKPRILLAEDNSDMRDYVRRLLEAHGWAVTAVENGQAALAAVRANRPGLVLSDVMMPLLDGFELLQALRREPGTSTIPVILMSARAGEEARVEGMEAGADDYLTKPFSARELVARVRTHWQLAGIRRVAEERLQEAKEAAEAANRSKDRFLAALSHELRTPLTPVLVTAAALQDDDRLPAEVREQLAMIERNISLEARLIDDLLDLTAISRDKLHLRQQPCDAHALIGLALEIVREEAVSKEISITREFMAEHSGLVADSARFQQVVWNLLRNAVKFTPRGGWITIRTEETPGEDGRPWLRLVVSDSGIGIEAGLLEKIFRPFEQGAATGDHRFGGMGLGLAIARTIVDLHGGRISAESEGLNHGAAFVVELPGAMNAPGGVMDGNAGSAGVVKGEGGAAEPDGRPRHLLLVEDHAPTLQAIATLLSRSGYRLTLATNVTDALTAAAQNQFDLVVSDLGLPDGSGIELMEQLRKQHGLRGIALTGYGMEADIARARDAGFVAHIVKPVHIAELRRVLASLSRATGDGVASERR